MKSAFFFVAIILQAIPFSTFGQKVVMDEFAQVREVKPFESISINGAFEVVLIQDSARVVVVSASDGQLRNLIETDVRGNTLYIGLKKSNVDWRGGRKFRAYVSMPILKKLDINGYSNLKVEKTFRANDLEVLISGSSDFHGNLECSNLTLTSSGSSDFHLEGKSDKVTINSSGSCDLKGLGFMVDYCDITCSGNSSIEITMNKEMRVTVSGGSQVNYKGQGMVKEFNASGKSSLNKLD